MLRYSQEYRLAPPTRESSSPINLTHLCYIDWIALMWSIFVRALFKQQILLITFLLSRNEQPNEQLNVKMLAPPTRVSTWHRPLNSFQPKGVKVNLTHLWHRLTYSDLTKFHIALLKQQILLIKFLLSRNEQPNVLPNVKMLAPPTHESGELL